MIDLRNINVKMPPVGTILLGAMAGLLVVIFVMMLYVMHANSVANKRQRDFQCAYATYELGGERLSAKDMSPQQKALAEAYDCDYPGKK